MFLQNLLQFSPGNSGFDSYIKRIYPILPDLKIFIKKGSPYISTQIEPLPKNLFLKNPLKLMHRYYLLQYFINCKKELLKNKKSS